MQGTDSKWIEANPIEKMAKNPQKRPKWPKNGFLTSKMSFPEHVTNRKVVGNGLFYLNMHFWPNPWHQFGEKYEKPQN